MKDPEWGPLGKGVRSSIMRKQAVSDRVRV